MAVHLSEKQYDEVIRLKAENVRLQNRIERLELVQRRLAKDLERAQS